MRKNTKRTAIVAAIEALGPDAPVAAVVDRVKADGGPAVSAMYVYAVRAAVGVPPPTAEAADLAAKLVQTCGGKRGAVAALRHVAGSRPGRPKKQHDPAA